MRWRLLLAGSLATAIVVAACATTPRAPESSCMQQTVDSLELDGLPGPRQHCLAAGAIALRCGGVSAFVAGYGKEFADLFGPGSFQRQDLQANRIGRKCASRVGSEDRLAACCADEGL